MHDAQVDITTLDGEMDCFVCHPDSGPVPAVILYMDVPGIREELREMSRYIAAQGYAVILPDLYYRDGKVRFDVSKGKEELERMFAISSKLTVDMVMRDTQGIIDYCHDHDNITDKIGCVGYCMSGPFAFAAAAAFPRQIAAAASFHGVRLFHAGPDSPHRAANAISAELYFGCAEQDEWAPPSLVNGLDRYLQSTSLNYRLEWYPGTQHGFVFPERDGIYQAEGAERHWARLLDLFGRSLASNG